MCWVRSKSHSFHPLISDQRERWLRVGVRVKKKLLAGIYCLWLMLFGCAWEL